MSNTVSLIVDAAAIALAIPSGGASLTLMEGLTIAGAAMNAVGTVTNNTALARMGSVAMLGAGVGEMVSPATFNASIMNSTAGVQASDAMAAQEAAASGAPVDAAGNTASAAAAPTEAANATTQAGTAGGAAASAPAPGAAAPAAPDVNTPTPATPAESTPTAPAANGETVYGGDANQPAMDIAKQQQGQGFLSKMWNGAGDQTKAAMIKVGGQALAGAAEYISPSPSQKAQIALANAQTSALQQQQGILAARNTVATPKGIATPAGAKPNSAWSGAPPATGYGPAVGYGTGVAQGYGPQVATPGLVSTPATGYGPQVSQPGLLGQAAPQLALNPQGGI